MVKIQDLSLTDRLLGILYLLPERSYNEDLGKISSFLYRHKSDLGARVKFDWNGSNVSSQDVEESYQDLHIAGYLHYSLPSLAFGHDASLLDSVRQTVLSKLDSEDLKRLGLQAQELSELLSS